MKDKKAHYVCTVKDHQPTLKSDSEGLDGSTFPPAHQAIDTGHGRMETRSIRTSTELNRYLDFPKIGQVACVEREVYDMQTRGTRHERGFLVTSLQPEQADPARLLALNRGHGRIENRVH